MLRTILITICFIPAIAANATVSPSFDEALQMIADFTPYLYNNYQKIDERNQRNEPMATFRGENTYGNNEQGVRHNADLSMICAFLCKYAKGKVVLPEGVSWDSLATMAMHTLTYSYSTHKANRLYPCKGNQYWGSVSERDHMWESSLWAMSVAYSAFFQWDRLNTQQRESIYQMLKAECNYELERSIPTNAVGDTKAEENGWECDVLAVTLGLFPNDKLAPRWFNRLREFAINSYSHKDDKIKNHQPIDPHYDDTTIADLYRGDNLYIDYTLQNHNYFHTSYQNVVAQELGEAALALSLFQRELQGNEIWLTNTLMHNIQAVFTEVLYGLALADGELAMPNGNDWSLFLYDQITSYSTASCFLRDPDALMLEKAALQQIQRRQKTTPDGSWLLRPDVGARRMGVEAHRVMMTWLMHHLLPTDNLEPSTWNDFRKRYANTIHFRYQDVITTSSPHRFSCFSWSKGLKNVTGYFAPVSDTSNNIVVPFRSGGTGNYIGWYDVAGHRTDASDIGHNIVMATDESFLIAGALVTNEGTLRNDYIMLTTPNNLILYLDITRATADVDILHERGGLLAISTDPFTSERRTLYYNSNSPTETNGDLLFKFKTDWINIDNCVGVVSRHIDGEGDITSQKHLMAFGDKGNNNSIMTSRLYAAYADSLGHFDKGATIGTRLFAYYSNVSASGTEKLSQEFKPLRQMPRGWAGFYLIDTDGTPYVVLCNTTGTNLRRLNLRKLQQQTEPALMLLVYNDGGDIYIQAITETIIDDNVDDMYFGAGKE